MTAEHAVAEKANVYRLGAASVIAFGAVALVAAFRLDVGTLADPGPGLWPGLVAAVLVLCGLLLLVVDSPSEYERWTSAAVKPLGAVAALAAFSVLFASVSFVPSTVAFLLVWFRVIAKESWRATLAITASATVVLYAVFAWWLAVPFPDPWTS